MHRIGGTLVVAVVVLLRSVVVAGPSAAAAVHDPSGIGAPEPRVITDKHGDDDPSPRDSGHGGGGDTGPVEVTGEIPAGTFVIRILGDDAFSPSTFEIDVGQSVTFVNQHHDDHSATGSGFDTGVIGPGETVTITFDKPGRFAFGCRFHPEMTGTIAVRGPDGTVPEATPAASVPPGAQSVRIADFQFQSPHLTVAVGDTVAWTNDGPSPHSVTATRGEFDAGVLDVGTTYAHTFEQPGAFAYVCVLHPDMRATIVVEGGVPPSSSAPLPSGSVEPVPSGPAVSATIVDFDFQPAQLDVVAGSTITWVNTGEYPHTVSADDGSFDSEILLPTETFSVTLTEAGTFTYHCNVHQKDMTGMIVVTKG